MTESDFARGRDLVESQLRPLGVRLVRDVSGGDQPFGNAYADFDAPHMVLRLLSDRGDVYLQISSVQDLDQHGESSHWYPLEGIIEFLSGELAGQRPTLSTLAVEIQFAHENWPALSQLFVEWPASKKRLDDFLRRRFRRDPY